MNSYNYTISFEWNVQPNSPAILGEKFLKTLDHISNAAPEIGSWHVIDLHHLKDERPALVLPIEEARGIITRLLEDNVSACQGYPEPDYGYRVLAANTPTETPRTLCWSGTVGGWFGDRIEFRAGHLMMPPDPDIVTYSLF